MYFQGAEKAAEKAIAEAAKKAKTVGTDDLFSVHNFDLDDLDLQMPTGMYRVLLFTYIVHVVCIYRLLYRIFRSLDISYQTYRCRYAYYYY